MEARMTSSAPPLKLLILFAIISLLLFLSSYPRYRYELSSAPLTTSEETMPHLFSEEATFPGECCLC
ncbi:hypothetical protein Bca52824_030276 [Brassica carinata]|uniref:Uncharacterized protein n=1 Tax=Brassica carinata TaxID=52824 RepID=A0A8X7S813_BRACI|nr:hypothetical protein Bca52824_030276 [Brassica carinata]